MGNSECALYAEVLICMSWFALGVVLCQRRPCRVDETKDGGEVGTETRASCAVRSVTTRCWIRSARGGRPLESEALCDSLRQRFRRDNNRESAAAALGV